MSHKAALQASLESTKVEYRKLGKCGLRVSVPILSVLFSVTWVILILTDMTASGAMSFGDPGCQSWFIDEEKVCSSEIQNLCTDVQARHSLFSKQPMTED